MPDGSSTSSRQGLEMSSFAMNRRIIGRYDGLRINSIALIFLLVPRALILRASILFYQSVITQAKSARSILIGRKFVSVSVCIDAVGVGSLANQLRVRCHRALQLSKPSAVTRKDRLHNGLSKSPSDNSRIIHSKCNYRQSFIIFPKLN